MGARIARARSERASVDGRNVRVFIGFHWMLLKIESNHIIQATADLTYDLGRLFLPLVSLTMRMIVSSHGASSTVWSTGKSCNVASLRSALVRPLFEIGMGSKTSSATVPDSTSTRS